jgi:hypothetical protein
MFLWNMRISYAMNSVISQMTEYSATKPWKSHNSTICHVSNTQKGSQRTFNRCSSVIQYTLCFIILALRQPPCTTLTFYYTYCTETFRHFYNTEYLCEFYTMVHIIFHQDRQ